MIKNLLYAISIRLGPLLVYIILRAWFVTCKVTLHDKRHLDAVAGADIPYIASFWHYSFSYVFYNLRSQEAAVMVSASKDGEYIARLAGHFGFHPVRGSKNKRGLLALKEMLKSMKNGNNAGIVADGSKGPPLKVQAGAILLASKVGVPILPLVWSADRYLRFNSWDKLSVPKPFAKIDCFYGEPFWVEANISADGIEEYRVKLEEQMNELYTKAWAVYGKKEH